MVPIYTGKKGNIIVFALSAMAVMSLSATVLATTTVLALRKGSNVEKAIFAKYNAESGVEQMLYIINQALRKNKDFDDIRLLIEDMFNLPPDSFDFDGSDALRCFDSEVPMKCEDINITLGVNDLPLNVSQNEAFTLNVFDVTNRNEPPYASQIDSGIDQKAGYVVDKITIDWSGGATHEFEFSFFVWDKVKLDAGGTLGTPLLPPIKRRVKGQDNITFSFKNGSPNIVPVRADTICTQDIDAPALAAIEQPICSIGRSQAPDEILLGTILIELISQGSLNGATLRLWEEDTDGVGGPDVDTQRQIPGFIEVRASGQEEANKKAIRVIQNISSGQATPGKQFISEIWDYAVFSDKSLSK